MLFLIPLYISVIITHEYCYIVVFLSIVSTLKLSILPNTTLPIPINMK